MEDLSQVINLVSFSFFFENSLQSSARLPSFLLKYLTQCCNVQMETEPGAVSAPGAESSSLPPRSPSQAPAGKSTVQAALTIQKHYRGHRARKFYHAIK